MARKPRRRAPLPDFDTSDSLRAIMVDHADFVARAMGEEPGDSKAFGGRHAAGRAALAHAEQLMKVTALMGGGGEDADDLGALLAQARAGLDAQDNDEETNADDAGGPG